MEGNPVGQQTSSTVYVTYAEEFEENAAEGPVVGRKGVGLAPEHFWGHAQWSATTLSDRSEQKSY